MTATKDSTAGKPWTARILRWGVVVLGIVACQAALYWPCLAGRDVLLPLDVLAQPTVYLPMDGAAPVRAHDTKATDSLVAFESVRRFVAGELAAGRFPQWLPYEFAGVPLVWPMYSPFLLLSCATTSPAILAWIQLLEACVAGCGAYAFCRRVLGIGFRSALAAAWCYPLTGFFVFWQGNPTGGIHWLPWLLLAVDGAVRRPGLRAVTGLGAATTAVLVSAHIDVAAQVLAMAGSFSLWCLWDARDGTRSLPRAFIPLLAGWTLGFLLAAPYVFPLLDYASEGARMALRGAGAEERPPVGLAALPQVVLPDLFGANRLGSVRYVAGVQIESSAAAYAGMIATVFLAPLAWWRRGKRSFVVFAALLAVLGIGWCLNLPGWVSLLRLPGLNMVSHNRFVFATAFAIVALAALGMDALDRREVGRGRWYAVPAAVSLGLLIWCGYRAVVLPDAIAHTLGAVVAQGFAFNGIASAAEVAVVQHWFSVRFAIGAVLAAISCAGWLIVTLRIAWRGWMTAGFGAMLVADLLVFSWDRSSQCDRALDFPPIPALEAVARDGPVRVIGVGCLPPTLSETAMGLWDIRGYDGVDPARMVQLLLLARRPGDAVPPYAVTQSMVPRFALVPPDGIRLHPILDMLGVRHVIFRGVPPRGIHPAFSSQDYWVMVNRSALPRLFVPARVGVEPDGRERLKKLASPAFDPRAMAWVEEPVALPAACRGQARIVGETPTRIQARVAMDTPGLVVLADRWDAGWHAYLDGRRVPVLRTNHALRGIVVPAGAAEIEFRYEPAPFRLGLGLCGAAVAGLALTALVRLRRRRSHRIPDGVQPAS